MGYDSIFTGLRDWDIHLEERMQPEWLFEAAFGLENSLASCAEELADEFLDALVEFDLDYNQDSPDWGPGEFQAWVVENAIIWLREWRKRIRQDLASLGLELGVGVDGYQAGERTMNKPSPSLPRPSPADYRLREIPYQSLGYEVIAPEGERTTMTADFQPWDDKGPWSDRSRLIQWVATAFLGGRVAMAEWTWQDARWTEEPECDHELRATIFPDYGGYCWDRYGAGIDCDLMLADVPEAQALHEAFEAWQILFERIPLDDLYQGATPEGGWEAFDARGNALCRQFVTLMGAEGVVHYRRSVFSPVLHLDDLLLYWERLAI
jgi:hypothetical protein